MVSHRGAAIAGLERRTGFGGVTTRNPLINKTEVSVSLSKSVINIC